MAQIFHFPWLSLFLSTAACSAELSNIHRNMNSVTCKMEGEKKSIFNHDSFMCMCVYAYLWCLRVCVCACVCVCDLENNPGYFGCRELAKWSRLTCQPTSGIHLTLPQLGDYRHGPHLLGLKFSNSFLNGKCFPEQAITSAPEPVTGAQVTDRSPSDRQEPTWLTGAHVICVWGWALFSLVVLEAGFWWSNQGMIKRAQLFAQEMKLE